MTDKEIIDFIQDWLNKKRLEIYFDTKKGNGEKYYKISKDDFYKFCEKFAILIRDNLN